MRKIAIAIRHLKKTKMFYGYGYHEGSHLADVFERTGQRGDKSWLS